MLRSFVQGILVTGKGGKQKKSKKRKHRNRQRNKNFAKRKLVRTWRQEPAVVPLTATGSTTPHKLVYVSCSHKRSLLPLSSSQEELLLLLLQEQWIHSATATANSFSSNIHKDKVFSRSPQLRPVLLGEEQFCYPLPSLPPITVSACFICS